MPYEYLDDVTTADVAFRARDATLEGLVIAAADALTNAMVDDLASVEPREERRIVVADEPADMLLFELLQELVFFKDAQELLLRVADVEITESRNGFTLTATARGETIDRGRHDLNVDVKAVTLHRFAVERADDGWEAFVIVDV